MSSLNGKVLLLGIGLAADRIGLDAAMWMLLAGPLVLIIRLAPEGHVAKV